MKDFDYMNGTGFCTVYDEKDFEKQKDEIIEEIKDILKDNSNWSIELEKEDGTSEYIVEFGVLTEKYKYLLEE